MFGDSSKPTTDIIKPFYEGKTFDQWIHIARFDRAWESQLKALQACAALVETEQEAQQILVPLRNLARKYGGNPYGGPYARFYPALQQGLESVSEDQILNFISTELSEGTQKSQVFCRLWLRGSFAMQASTGSSRNWTLYSKLRPGDPKWAAMQKRIPEIADVIAANFSKPTVVSFVSQFGEPLAARMKNTKVADKIKELVLTGTLQQRFDMQNVALAMFVDDDEVLEKYESDLFNPATTETRVKVIDSPSSKLWRTAKVDLAKLILSNLMPSRESNATPEADDATVAKRIEKAADLLAKVTDKILAGEEKRVWVNDSFGSSRGRSDEVPIWIRQAFYDIGSQSDDSEVKQLLLNKLASIQKHIEEQLEGSTNRELKEINYLVALYKGDPDAEPPSNTVLQLRQPEVRPAKKD